MLAFILLVKRCRAGGTCALRAHLDLDLDSDLVSDLDSGLDWDWDSDPD